MQDCMVRTYDVICLHFSRWAIVKIFDSENRFRILELWCITSHNITLKVATESKFFLGRGGEGWVIKQL